MGTSTLHNNDGHRFADHEQVTKILPECEVSAENQVRKVDLVELGMASGLMSNVRVQDEPIEDLNASLLFEKDMKAIAAGWNPMLLKRGICVCA